MTRRNKIIAIVATISISCVVLGFAAVRALDAMWKSELDDPSLESIEHYARVKLPAQATNRRAMVDGFQDKRAWVRFDLPADRSADWVQKNLPGATTLSSPPEWMTTMSPATTRDWWKPLQSSNTTCYQLDKAGSYSQTVVIHQVNEKTHTLYLLTADQ
jgi:hypothetical protein